jgi:hypothetical protein
MIIKLHSIIGAILLFRFWRKRFTNCILQIGYQEWNLIENVTTELVIKNS